MIEGVSQPRSKIALAAASSENYVTTITETSVTKAKGAYTDNWVYWDHWTRQMEVCLDTLIDPSPNKLNHKNCSDTS